MAMTAKQVQRKLLAIQATPEDLDNLRMIFTEMAADKESPGYNLARRMMAAVHRCRRKHGFKWVH